MNQFSKLANNITGHIFIGNPYVNYLLVGEIFISSFGFYALLTLWNPIAVAIIFALGGFFGMGQKYLMNNTPMRYKE